MNKHWLGAFIVGWFFWVAVEGDSPKYSGPNGSIKNALASAFASAITATAFWCFFP